MGYAIADQSYTNLVSFVHYIHNKVYKGNRDRNRYRINHHLYVWYEAGRVTKILDRVRHQSIDLTTSTPKTVNNVDSLGNIGFYADVTEMHNEAALATQPQRSIEAYTKAQSFHQIITSNTNLLLDVFA